MNKGNKGNLRNGSPVLIASLKISRCYQRVNLTALLILVKYINNLIGGREEYHFKVVLRK